MVQWLRLQASSAGRASSVPSQGPRSHIPQLRSAKQINVAVHSNKLINLKKKKTNPRVFCFPSVSSPRPPVTLKTLSPFVILKLPWPHYLSSCISCLPPALQAPALSQALFVFLAQSAFLPDPRGTYCLTSVNFLLGAPLSERPFLPNLSDSSPCWAPSSASALPFLLVFNRWGFMLHMCRSCALYPGMWASWGQGFVSFMSLFPAPQTLHTHSRHH